jgi:hypothetical protein
VKSDESMFLFTILTNRQKRSGMEKPPNYRHSIAPFQLKLRLWCGHTFSHSLHPRETTWLHKISLRSDCLRLKTNAFRAEQMVADWGGGWIGGSIGFLWENSVRLRWLDGLGEEKTVKCNKIEIFGVICEWLIVCLGGEWELCVKKL